MTSMNEYDEKLTEVIEYLHIICDDIASDEIIELTIKPSAPEAQQFMHALNYLMDLRNIRTIMHDMRLDVPQS